MRHALLLLALAIAPAVAHSQGPAPGPAYQRMRTGADQWSMRGGMNGWGHGPGGSGWGGFYNPNFFAPPIVTGSWYQRPYPYHFDYYRYRWGAQQGGYGAAPGVAAPDCPCAMPPPVEVVE